MLEYEERMTFLDRMMFLDKMIFLDKMTKEHIVMTDFETQDLEH